MARLSDVKKILKDFFEKMGIGISAEHKESEEGLEVNIIPDDNKLTSLLIGYKGENLQTLQYMMRILIRKKIGEPFRLILDVNGYREHRLESIREMVLNLAEKVKKTQRIELVRPMTAYERRVVHVALKEISGVETQSVGEEPNRRVIIRPEE